MTKLIYFAFSLLIMSTAWGTPVNEGLKENNLYSNLVAVNQEWEQYEALVPNLEISFANDETRIQTHLKLVISFLKTHYKKDLSQKQLKNRLELLAALEAYANEKVFPKNTKFSHRQPCFVDDFDTHCAVGYMMAFSGNTALVSEIKAQHNDDFIRDIKTNGITEWAEYYGFSLDELKWIQPSYPPTESYASIENGTNGTVNYINSNYGSPGFVFSGDFSSVNLLPCLNIGVYDGEALSCIGGGMAGIINGISKKEDRYYVFGALENDGEIYPLAIFEDDAWTFIAHPELEGATVSAALIQTSNSELAISHPSFEGQEIWFYSGAGEWTKKGEIDGIVKVIEPSGLGRIYAGHFTAAQTISDEGELSDLTGNNILIRQNYSGEWSMLDEDVSDTIKAVYVLGTSLFFGGSAGTDLESDICLSRYYSGVMQPLIKLPRFGSPPYASINAIEFDGQRNLYFGGHFYMEEMLTYGRHLGRYDLVYNSIVPMSQFNEKVHALYIKSGALYIGGDFTSDLVNDNYNHLVELLPTIDILTNEISIGSELKFYPNPFTDYIRIEGVSEGLSYQLINAAGNVVRQGVLTNQIIANLSDLPAGNYFVLLQQANEVLNFKVVK